MPSPINLSILNLHHISLSVLNDKGTQERNEVFVTSEDLVLVYCKLNANSFSGCFSAKSRTFAGKILFTGKEIKKS